MEGVEWSGGGRKYYAKRLFPGARLRGREGREGERERERERKRGKWIKLVKREEGGRKLCNEPK